QHTLRGSHLRDGAPLLEVDQISLRFGGVKALRDLSLTVTEGDIHAIIGPNGAGKSSLLTCISGLYHPQEGEIRLHTAAARADGTTGEARTHRLTRLPPYKIARLAVARSVQTLELFPHTPG